MARALRVAVQMDPIAGINSGNCRTKSFSGAFLTLAGSFTTSVFGWMCSSRCVAVM